MSFDSLFNYGNAIITINGLISDHQTLQEDMRTQLICCANVFANYSSSFDITSVSSLTNITIQQCDIITNCLQQMKVTMEDIGNIDGNSKSILYTFYTNYENAFVPKSIWMGMILHDTEKIISDCNQILNDVSLTYNDKLFLVNLFPQKYQKYVQMFSFIPQDGPKYFNIINNSLN
jgi:hypothetical protein